MFIDILTHSIINRTNGFTDQRIDLDLLFNILGVILSKQRGSLVGIILHTRVDINRIYVAYTRQNFV